MMQTSKKILATILTLSNFLGSCQLYNMLRRSIGFVLRGVGIFVLDDLE